MLEPNCIRLTGRPTSITVRLGLCGVNWHPFPSFPTTSLSHLQLEGGRGGSNANKNLPVSNPSEVQAFRQPSFHGCRSSRFHRPHIRHRLWKRVLNQDTALTWPPPELGAGAERTIAYYVLRSATTVR